MDDSNRKLLTGHSSKNDGDVLTGFHPGAFEKAASALDFTIGETAFR